MTSLSPTRASRKYVDLINRSSGSFVNWDPTRRLEAGDFGRIDPETGQFVCEGNIYRDEPLASIAKDYPAVTTEPVYELKMDSSSATRMSTLPDFRDLSDVVYKCQWKFRAKRAAFMVMLRARKTNVPTAFLNMALKEDSPVPEIGSKSVITGVWSCPAFAMYLSDKASEHVKIALRVSNTESGQETGWHAEGNVGVYQFGSLPNGEYIPLYQLQTIQTKSLGHNKDGEDETETIWAPAGLPWRRLDDDGVEAPHPEHDERVGT